MTTTTTTTITTNGNLIELDYCDLWLQVEGKIVDILVSLSFGFARHFCCTKRSTESVCLDLAYRNFARFKTKLLAKN